MIEIVLGQSVLVLVGLRLYVPVNKCLVMSERSHRFLGITSTFWEVNWTELDMSSNVHVYEYSMTA